MFIYVPLITKVVYTFFRYFPHPLLSVAFQIQEAIMRKD